MACKLFKTKYDKKRLLDFSSASKVELDEFMSVMEKAWIKKSKEKAEKTKTPKRKRSLMESVDESSSQNESPKIDERPKSSRKSMRINEEEGDAWGDLEDYEVWKASILRRAALMS